MILKKQGEFDRFVDQLPAGVRAVVIWGRDRSGVRERADRLAGRVTTRPDDPFDSALLTELDLVQDEDRLEAELQALSFAAARRLVRLRLTEGKAAVEKIAAAVLARHLEGDLNPDAFLLIEAGALTDKSALRRAAEKAENAVSVPVYEAEATDLARMARDGLAADGLTLSADALALFVRRLPADRGVARAEIERLALYLGPGRKGVVEAADLEPFLGVEPDASLQEAAMDAFGARAAAAQAGLRRALAEGETGPAAVRHVSLHLGRLKRFTLLRRNGADAPQAAKAVGVFWKQEREFLRQAQAWSPAEIERLQPLVLEADRLCKRAGSPDRLLAERLVMAVAATARRLGL